MSELSGNKVIKGSIWAAFDKFGTLGIQFIVNLILARLLFPEEFGVVGVLTIFIAVSNTLIDGGFGSALIQKKQPTQTDYSTIFWWNLGFSLSLYLILFLAAPCIADFFDMPLLCGVLRGLGLSLIFTSISSLQANRLQKHLEFNSIAATNLISYIISGVITITLAFYDWGVWSLVVLQVIQGLLRSIIFFLISGWYPSLRFSLQSLRSLFGFGGYLLIANVLQEACKNIQGFIIGKRFSPTQMGYFSQAYKLDNITSYSIPQIIVQVMFPVYSAIQDDTQRLIELLRMNVRVIAYIVFPVLSMLILCAEPLILTLYGVKWLPSVPYFRILCVGGMFVSLQNVNFYAVASRGKSNILFWISFYKWGMLLVLLVSGMVFGMEGLLWGMVLSNLNIYIVNAILVARYVGLSLCDQLLTLLPVIGICMVSIGSAFAAKELLFIHWSVAIIIFVTLYITLSVVFRMRALVQLREIVMMLRKRG